jgi:hypothetical protein
MTGITGEQRSRTGDILTSFIELAASPHSDPSPHSPISLRCRRTHNCESLSSRRRSPATVLSLDWYPAAVMEEVAARCKSEASSALFRVCWYHLAGITPSRTTDFDIGRFAGALSNSGVSG